MVQSASLLDKYPWTGHSVIMGKRKNGWQNTQDVLLRFGQKEKQGITRYRSFVLEGWSQPERNDLEGGGLKRSAGGWEGVKLIKKMKNPWRSDERILGSGNFVGEVLKTVEEKMKRKAELVSQGWNQERLLEKVLGYFKLQKEDLIRKRRDSVASAAKSVFAYLGYEELKISGQQLTEFLNISRPGLSQLIQKGRTRVKENNVKLLS